MKDLDHPDDPVLDLLQDLPHGTEQVALIWIDRSGDGDVSPRLVWAGMDAESVARVLYNMADEVVRQRIPLSTKIKH